MNINTPTCVVGGANTGIPACAMAPDKFIGAILIDRNKTFTEAELQDFITTLQSLTLSSGKNRAYPIFRFEELADNSEEETVSTLGYGSKQVAKEGKYDWTFRLLKGGLCFQSKLRAFNKSDKKVLFVDSNNIIFGTRASNGEVTGFSMDFFYAKPFKAADGSNAAIFQVRFALSKPGELNDSVVYINPGVDVEESVKGVVDVELTKVSAAAGSIKVAVKTVCDKTDLYDSFADDLASGSLWKLSKAGTPVAVTTVEKDEATKSFTLTFTGTAGTYQVALASASVLAAAGIGGAPENGFEGSPLTVTIP